MIPKTIHYCWFGGKPIPKTFQRYINSWNHYLKDYEIKQWNETNYDVNCISFSKEAYRLGKYAYVSDYARLRILYEHGGVYFDTDVEAIRDLNPVITKGPWMAIEKHKQYPEKDDMVALGLGFAVEPNNHVVKEIMKVYENSHFQYPDGHIEQIPIVPITTKVLRKYGLPSHVEKPLNIEGITIYPWDYFCPQEFLSSIIEITPNTFTVHHYSASWMSKIDLLKMYKGKWGYRIKKILSFLSMTL